MSTQLNSREFSEIPCQKCSGSGSVFVGAFESLCSECQGAGSLLLDAREASEYLADSKTPAAEEESSSGAG